VSWQQPKRALQLRRLAQVESSEQADGTVHEITLAPNFYRLVTDGYPPRPFLLLNQSIFRSTLTGLVNDVRPDVLVYSSSHHWTGYPPFVADAPIVFDYVDLSPAHVERAYARAASAVVAVTPELASAVARYRKPTTVIPNGVDVRRYASVGREAAKARLGLEDHRVVSLIGLTSSPRLYFVDAVARVQQELPDVLLLIVGGGPRSAEIRMRIEQAGVTHARVLGPIPNSEIHWYFAASDVGLYPADDYPYFRLAFPLKVVEYAAAGAQIVTSPLESFRRWECVRSASADARSFAHAIMAALEEPHDAVSVAEYDWCRLAGAFEDVIERAACGVGKDERASA
jgi:glycosyltransferase involved in cell wall biosynthesis